MPKGRTYEYQVYRACERFGIRPPGYTNNFSDLDMWQQILMIAYSQGRTIEEAECARL